MHPLICHRDIFLSTFSIFATISLSKRSKIPTMSGENWIKGAMSDDSLVADALLRLRHSEPPKKSDASPLKLKWSVRQRRSKKGDQTRASPTTPLSWSGATSLSGGATIVEGIEESSAAVKHSEAFRSKVCLIISLDFLYIRFEINSTMVVDSRRYCFVCLTNISLVDTVIVFFSSSFLYNLEFPCCLR